MRTSQLKNLIKVLPINKDAAEIIFIDQAAMSFEDGAKLAKMLKEAGAEFHAIAFTGYNPNEAIMVAAPKPLTGAGKEK